MFELTSAQRECFGLSPVESTWTRTELKPSPYDDYQSYAYIDGTVIRKCILSGKNRYVEYELIEQLSDDGKYLLPKTSKGKPVLLSSSTLQKRHGIGMCLSYHKDFISLMNHASVRTYYSSAYAPLDFNDLDGFIQWVEQWCSETTAEDRQDIALFASERRKHVKYREGDVFRFKIDRRLYGYGRILLDYDRMRKRKEPFWDILMTKPLVCNVYHIVTEDRQLTVDDLKDLPSLPSAIITDNAFFYGDHEIIGNIPLGDREDHPIMYGNSIHMGDHAVVLQCGRSFRRIENGAALFRGFTNNGVSFSLNVRLPVLLDCINEKSNAPYWAQTHWAPVDHDLRDPKFRAELEQICMQFDIPLSQLIK